MKLESERNKMEKLIDKHGLNNKKTITQSQKLDKLINKAMNNKK